MRQFTAGKYPSMNSDLNGPRIPIKKVLSAVKSGDREIARIFARHASTLAPELEQPWLILAALSDLEETLPFFEFVEKKRPNPG
jgi:uncharacterized membrane-anchored protein